MSQLQAMILRLSIAPMLAKNQNSDSAETLDKSSLNARGYGFWIWFGGIVWFVGAMVTGLDTC